MRSIRVVGSQVWLENNNLRIGCHRNFGGAALDWFAKPSSTRLVSAFPGEACNTVFDTGNDGTQASPDGLTENPITSITNEAGYYGCEMRFVKPYDSVTSCQYGTIGPIPFFWASLERIDDCLPIDPRGDHGWNTQYHNFLNLPASTFSSPGVPLIFSPRPGVPSGLILIGDEIKQYYSPNVHWTSAVTKIENGNVAFAVNINLRLASADAIAGIIFRKKIPDSESATIHDLYTAPGYQLNINKQGVVQFVRNNVEILWSSPRYYTEVTSAKGLNVELRTHKDNYGAIDIIINGALVQALTRLEGRHEAFGCFASCSSGQIWFSSRRVTDMNVLSRNTWTVLDDQIYLFNEITAPYIPFYRMNLPVVFIDAPIRQGFEIKSKNGTHYLDDSLFLHDIEIAPGIFDANKIDSLWIGRHDHSAGLFLGKFHFALNGYPSGEAHIGISPGTVALNPLSFLANQNPSLIQRASVEIEDIRSNIPEGW